MKKIALIIVLLCILVLGFIFFTTRSSKPSSPAVALPHSSTQTITLYYYSSTLDQDESGNILCSEKGLVGVKRKISDSKKIIDDTIRLLIKGQLTSDEKNQGITTEFPLPNFEFIQSDLQDNILTITFKDPLFKTSGGACRVQILQQQIVATAKQFNEVSQVIFEPNDLFQP